MPREYIEWDLIFRTGWTLEYVRSLTMQDYHDYLLVVDARRKAGIK